MKFLLLALPSLLASFASAALLPRSDGGVNDFSCKSASQPVPLVFFHGLLGSKDNQLYDVQKYLAGLGYCTFQITYGALPQDPAIGGVRPINESSQVLASYVAEVASKTGVSKVDIVSYSEGAFLSLYVPKFTSARSLIRKVVALAPPAHGTTVSGINSFAKFFGYSSFLNLVLQDVIQCDACVEVEPDAAEVKALNDGPIAQEGITYSIIATRYDELVTPAPKTSIVNERGVRNVVIQDYCPLDTVGHLNAPTDRNYWNLLLNELQDELNRDFDCTVGIPLK